MWRRVSSSLASPYLQPSSTLSSSSSSPILTSPSSRSSRLRERRAVALRSATAVQSLMSASGSDKQSRKDEYLLSLGRESYVSHRGQASLLATVSSEGLPDNFSRSTQYRARKRRCGIQTPYGTLVEEVELGLCKKTETPVVMAVANPLALLHQAASTTAFFANCIRFALAASPSSKASPWSIVVCICFARLRRMPCYARL